MKVQALTYFLLLCLLSAEAAAQPPSLLRFYNWQGNLRLIYQKQQRWYSGLVKEKEFQEQLNLRTSGYIITPRLFTFGLTGAVSLLQEKVEDPLTIRANKSRFVNQSFTGTFFPRSTHSLIVSYSRGTNYQNLEFSGVNLYRFRTLQATLDLPALYLTSRLFATRRSLTDKWERADYRFFRYEDRTEFGYRGTRNTETSHVSVNYDYYRFYNKISRAMSYRSHIGRFQWDRVFGQAGQHKSKTLVKLQSRSGFIEYRDMRLRQWLDIRHRPWLSSFYRYSVIYRKSAGVSSVQNSVTAGLNYSLYQSLKASTRVSGVFTSSSVGDFRHRTIGASLAYTKKLPLSSRIQLTYSRNVSLTFRETQSVEQQVLNERHVVIGGRPFLLNERNIVPGSIVIYSERTLIQYQEGEDKDYIVRYIGDAVEIQINPLGRIPENDVLLVSYRFRTLPTMRYTTDNYLFSASLKLGPFNLYHNETMHDIQILYGDPFSTAPLTDIYIRATGIRTGFRSRLYRLSIMVERKLQESSRLTYTYQMVRGSLIFVPAFKFSLSANAEYYDFDYFRDGVKTLYTNIKTGLRWRPTYDLTMQLFWNIKRRRRDEKLDETIYEYGGFIQRTWPVMWIRLTYERRKWFLGPRLLEDRWLRVELNRRL